MKRLIQSALMFAAICGLALPTLAQEEGRRGDGERRPGTRRPDGERRPGAPGREGRGGFGGFRGGDASEFLFSFPRNITLDDAQKAKLEALKKEYEPKVKEATAKVDKIMTEERRTKMREAFTKLRESGQRVENPREVLNEALGLSEEERKELQAAEDARRTLYREISEKKNEILTEEQRQALPRFGFGRRPGGRPDGAEGDRPRGPRGPRGERRPNRPAPDNANP